MDNYKIYMHKNKINNKVYIGQTKQSLTHRWNNGKGYINCPYFYHAIQKYGWDNFEHILLEDGLSKEDADNKEKSYIQQYQSFNPEYGYNISLGGAGLTGATKYKDFYKYTLDGVFVKYYKDIADILLENPNYQPHSLEEAYDGIYSQAYGFQWRPYYNENVENVKVHKAKIGRTKIVYQYDSNGLFIRKFNDIKEASEITGFSRSGISKCCNDKQESFNGYQWKFYYAESIAPIDVYVVCKYDINGKLLKIYNTPKEAAMDIGVSSSNIVNCYHGRCELAGGFVWKKYNISKEEVKENIEIKLTKTKLVELIDENNNVIKMYHSAEEAARDLGFKDAGGVRDVCNGIYKQTHGYRFRYPIELD